MMRINAYRIGVALALLTSLLFTSCDSDDGIQDPIVDPSEMFFAFEQGGFVPMTDDAKCNVTLYIHPNAGFDPSSTEIATAFKVVTLEYEGFSTDPDFELRWKLMLASLHRPNLSEPIYRATLVLVDNEGNIFTPKPEYKYKLEFNKTSLKFDNKYRSGEFNTSYYYGIEQE